MVDKITLTNLVNLTNQTTAVNAINANNAAITTAFDNTISRDGTQPNQMGSTLDMNNQQILNLPTPATGNSPVRLQDIATLQGGGTIVPIPGGGTQNQVLAKNSSINYDASWHDIEPLIITGGTNITVTSDNPAVIATTATPTFTTVNTATIPTVVDTLVGRNTTDTLTNKTITSPTITGGTYSGTLTSATGLPISTGLTGLGTGVATALGTNVNGSGAISLTTSPTFVTPILGAATATSVAFNPTTGGIVGTTVADNASAGTVGEFITSFIPVGSAVSLTSGVAKTVTSINLTAGDWDVRYSVWFNPSTTLSQGVAALNTTTNTLPANPGVEGYTDFNATFSSANSLGIPGGPARFNVSTTTTIFLVVQAGFGGSCLGYGTLSARRIR